MKQKLIYALRHAAAMPEPDAYLVATLRALVDMIGE